MSDKVELCRLSDNKVSCQLEDREFYILPNRMECSLEDIAKAMDVLIIVLDEQKEKDIEEAIEQELGKRAEMKIEW